MRLFLKFRVLPFVVVFSILVSLCVIPASAVEFPELATIRPEAIYDINLLESELKRLAGEKDSDNCAFVTNSYYLSNPRNWTAVSYDTLATIATFWNYTYQEKFSITAQVVDTVLEDGTKLSYIRAHLKDSVYQGRDALQWCFTDGAYNVLVAPSEDVDAEFDGVWIPEDSFHSPYRYMGYEDLMNLAYDLRADVAYNDLYYYIYREDGQLVYANSSGLPFVAVRDSSGHASQNDRPAVDDPEDEIDDEFDAKIDLENGIINLPDGTLAYLDAVIYDESNKTYYVDSHDVENNYYYFHYEYHINYTSITYIGQTEEYNKYYEVYYELPDGRDSADLTKEDLEQLNLSVDVIPYGRSADDTSLRSLYHFDGDTRDSSYWNYCTAFTWNKGASLTYMDAAVFDGALYLDEQEHDFTLTLPSNITSGGFTLQFRYYQSYTAAPQTDSYIDFGGTTVMQFDGGFFKNADGNAMASTPVGTWNEVALIFDNGIMYYYLNGVCIGSQGGLVPSGNTIKFHFGSAQQTYKYFDELRVLNYALKTGGAYYEPTSVPHDTNLSLVLPGSAVPVADEYWSITSSVENLIDGDFTSGDLSSVTIYEFDEKGLNGHNKMADFPQFSCNSFYTSLTSFSNFARVQNLSSDKGYVIYSGDYHWAGGLFVKVGKRTGDTLADGDYVFSIVLADGTVLSCPFSWPTSNVSNYGFTRQQYDWGEFGVATTQQLSSSDYVFLYILPKVGGYVDVAYAELIPGTSTDLEAEWVTSVTEMTEDQFKTPTLAVRTDLDITSYQIGGVRPSIPEKGQVWAMVENERITSIQIYNGQAWEGVDGRIWTGSRWIPASSYNIITLQDMYDIVDATPNYEYIYSEAGFWAWWQKSWNAFTEKLFVVLGSGGAGGSGASGGAGSSEMSNVDLDAEDPVSDPAEEDSKSLWQFIVLVVSGGKSVISGTRELFSGAVSSVPESMGDIVSTFDSGGLAVGLLDGSYLDPDLADLPQDDSGEAAAEIEEVDPWRYR